MTFDDNKYRSNLRKRNFGEVLSTQINVTTGPRWKISDTAFNFVMNVMRDLFPVNSFDISYDKHILYLSSRQRIICYLSLIYPFHLQDIGKLIELFYFKLRLFCVVILLESTAEYVSHAKPDRHCCNVSNELTYKFHFIAFSETQRFLRTTSLCMIKSSRE